MCDYWICDLKVLCCLKTRLGERERKAKKGLSKANTEEAFNNPQRAVNVSLATVVSSDDGVDALAAALAALHAFYELGRSPTTVSSTYIKSHQVQETAANPAYFLKGNIKGCVSAGCIFRQT